MTNARTITIVNGIPAGPTGTATVSSNDAVMDALAAGIPVNATIVAGVNTNARKAASASAPVADSGLQYQAVAASASATALVGTGSGALGDYLSHLLVVVATAATAQVQITDGSGSAITVFPNSPGAGVGSYPVPIGAFSKSGAWKITTGAGASVVAFGDFT